MKLIPVLYLVCIIFTSTIALAATNSTNNVNPVVVDKQTSAVFREIMLQMIAHQKNMSISQKEYHEQLEALKVQVRRLEKHSAELEAGTNKASKKGWLNYLTLIGVCFVAYNVLNLLICDGAQGRYRECGLFLPYNSCTQAAMIGFRHGFAEGSAKAVAGGQDSSIILIHSR